MEVKQFRPLICPVCGKEFYPAPFHRYHDKRQKCSERDANRVCSYHCMRESESKGKNAMNTQPEAIIKECKKRLHFEAWLQRSLSCGRINQ